MQIGNSITSNAQSNALSLLRQMGRSDVAAQTGDAGASVSRGHGHHHDRMRTEGNDLERLQARLQRLSAMLEKLTAQSPEAQAASYAALVLDQRGGPVVATTTANPGEAAGDSLDITALSISDVTTSAGNDVVTLAARQISGIYTGAGSDSLSITGGIVSGIHTDAAGPVAPAPVVDPAPAPVDPVPVAAEPSPVAAAPVPVAPVPAEPVPEIDTSGSAATPVVAAPVLAGNDALSIAAYLISDVTTGDGNDALALSGKLVSNIDAGAGNDAIAIRAKVVTGVTGGDGDDAIAVDAKVGVAGLANAAGWFAVAAEPVVATTGDATAQIGAAAKAYADVDGGAGNDVITVRTASVLAVAGGTGNDTINAQGGTISLVYGAGDGDDTVNVAAGAQVVLQLGAETGPYTLEFGADSMTVRMLDGSVTFRGIGAGTIGIKQGDGGMALITQPFANGLNLAV